jgi:hypothetical protein
VAANVTAQPMRLPHSMESVHVQPTPSQSASAMSAPLSCPSEISAHTCRSEEDDGSSVVPPEEEVGRWLAIGTLKNKLTVISQHMNTTVRHLMQPDVAFC